VGNADAGSFQAVIPAIQRQQFDRQLPPHSGIQANRVSGSAWMTIQSVRNMEPGMTPASSDLDELDELLAY
jgi:hypothetical protein